MKEMICNTTDYTERQKTIIAIEALQSDGSTNTIESLATKYKITKELLDYYIELLVEKGLDGSIEINGDSKKLEAKIKILRTLMKENKKSNS